jgi:DNA-binding transcriptional ArsR family regulator
VVTERDGRVIRYRLGDVVIEELLERVRSLA